MYPTAHPIAVNGTLLNEVATSGSFPDPLLFCYGVAAILFVLLWVVGYLFLGRAKNAERRSVPNTQVRNAESATVTAAKPETCFQEQLEAAARQTQSQPPTPVHGATL